MIKDYFLNNIETAIENAIKDNKLGEMKEYVKGTLSTERPKNSDFGDFALNVSPLARYARMAPPQIANTILSYIDKEDNDYTVIGGFINFKTGSNLLKQAVEKIFKRTKITDDLKKLKKKKFCLSIFQQIRPAHSI